MLNRHLIWMYSNYFPLELNNSINSYSFNKCLYKIIKNYPPKKSINVIQFEHNFQHFQLYIHPITHTSSFLKNKKNKKIIWKYFERIIKTRNKPFLLIIHFKFKLTSSHDFTFIFILVFIITKACFLMHIILNNVKH